MTTEAPRNLKFRLLEERDRPAIEEIASLTYGGHDFVGYLFQEYLTDPACDAIVADSDGKCIGLNVIRTIDGGKVGWVEGLRVHPSARGHGLGRDLIAESIRRAREAHAATPNFCLRYSLYNTNAASMAIGRGSGFESVASVGLIWALDMDTFVPKLEQRLALELEKRKGAQTNNNNSSNITTAGGAGGDEGGSQQQQQQQQQEPQPQQCGGDGVPYVATDACEEVAAYMHKHGLGHRDGTTFSIDWKFYEVTAANLQKQANKFKSFTMLKSPEDGHTPPCLSIGTDRTDHVGVSWCSSVYSNDAVTVVAHMLHHARNARAFKAQLFMGFFEEHLCPQLNEWGLIGEPPGPYMLLVEKVLCAPNTPTCT